MLTKLGRLTCLLTYFLINDHREIISARTSVVIYGG